MRLKNHWGGREGGRKQEREKEKDRGGEKRIVGREKEKEREIIEGARYREEKRR